MDGCGACDEDNRTAQKRVLSLILSMAARLSLPLALSCAGGAESDLRTALDDSGLPADAALHLFEFSGDADFLVLRLMRAWPNLYVGFDGRLTHAKAEHLRGLLFDVPMERLLIQSSAPNHIPASLPGQRYCHPGMLPEIAVKVAQLKEMELGEVMEQARANVKAVYGI